MSPATTAICAEQGTATAMSAVAMNRSRFEPRMRVVSVPMVTQPSPRISGMIARPLRPTAIRERSASAAMRGR